MRKSKCVDIMLTIRRLLLATCYLLLAVVAVSCTSGPPPSPAAVQEPGEKAASVPQGWEQQWAEKVAVAKKEGKINFYSSANPQTRIALANGLKEKFGIELEFMTGSAPELIRRIQAERQAGIKMVDVFNDGGYALLTSLKPLRVLEPLEPYLILPEVRDTKLWYGNRLPFLDKDGQAFAFLSGVTQHLVINTEMVKEGQIRSYMDLLNPEWKGKILIYDPTVSGGGMEWASLMLINILGEEKGKEYLIKFTRQEPTVVRDTRLSAEWVARGKYPLVIGPYKQAVSEFLSIGAPLKFLKTDEGGLLAPSGGVLSKVQDGPNVNAATVFTNWLLTREGQAIFAKNFGFPSARLDVPPEGMDPTLIPVPGEKINVTDEEWYLARDRLLPVFKEIFAPLLR